MPSNFFLAILFLFLNTSFAMSAEVSSVYGKIRTSKKSIHGLTSPYFVTFEHEGKLLAYPIDTNSRAMADDIKYFIDKDALLEGEIKKTSFKVDGNVYTIEKFIPKSIKRLELSALGQETYRQTEKPDAAPDMKEKRKESALVLGPNNPHEGKLGPTRGPKQGLGVGFRINDSVANGLIFTGAAAIIGTQLFKKK